jgi:integrase
MACVYKRKYRDKKTDEWKEVSTYTMKYYVGGKAIVKSTGLTNRRKATQMAKQEEAEALKGETPWEYDSVTFDDLIDNLIIFYEVNKRKSIDRLMRSVNHLNNYFEGRKAKIITPAVVRNYIKHRQGQKKKTGKPYATATINRELAALKTAFKLAQREGRIAKVPYIELLQENNVKEGYLSPDDFKALYQALHPYLKTFAMFCYLTGMRKEEVINLQWSNVDFNKQEIKLEGSANKSGESRIIPFKEGNIKAIIERQRSLHIVIEKISPYIFPNKDLSGPIKDFRSVWNTACRKADLGYGYKLSTKYVEKWQKKLPPGPTLHDFRRSMATNAIEAGVSEKVVMEMGGWKTPSVMRRYQIVKKYHLEKAFVTQDKYLLGTANKPRKRTKVVRMRKVRKHSVA